MKSLSVMIALHRHNLKSRLYETEGRQSSSDLVGDSRRQLFAQEIAKVDPFDMSRPPATHSSAKSRGSPFAGLSSATMKRFVADVKEDFSLLYPHMWAPSTSTALTGSQALPEPLSHLKLSLGPRHKLSPAQDEGGWDQVLVQKLKYHVAWIEVSSHMLIDMQADWPAWD